MSSFLGKAMTDRLAERDKGEPPMNSKQQDDLSLIIKIMHMSDSELVDFLLPDRDMPVQHRFAREILLKRLEDTERYKQTIINWSRG